ncbi:MAG: hypothetical protein CNLJKLNK_00084 [Holosporales bacterium]
MKILKFVLLAGLSPLYCATEHNPFMRIDSSHSSWDEIGSQTPFEKSTTWTFVPEEHSPPKSPFEEILSPEIKKIGSKKNLNYFYQKIMSNFSDAPEKLHLKTIFFNFIMMFYQVNLNDSIGSQKESIPLKEIEKIYKTALKKMEKNRIVSKEGFELMQETYNYLKKTYLRFIK